MSALKSINQAPELLEQLLPENPQDGDIVRMPDGYSCGESIDIQIYDKFDRIGVATTIDRVENVSNIYLVNRLSANRLLKPGDKVRILNARYLFVSMRFVEYIGWVGHRVAEPHEVTHDEDYEILETVTIVTTGDMVVHEQVCLKQIKKENRDEQPTSPRAGSDDRR